MSVLKCLWKLWDRRSGGHLASSLRTGRCRHSRSSAPHLQAHDVLQTRHRCDVVTELRPIADVSWALPQAAAMLLRCRHLDRHCMMPHISKLP